MGGVIKAPLESDSGDAVFIWIHMNQLPAALLQPLIQYAVTDRKSFFGEKQMQIAG